MIQLCALASVAAMSADPTNTIDEIAPRAIAVLPRGLTSHAAAELNGWLYVYGGYFGEPHEYCREDQSRSFLRLNLHDGLSWEHLSDQAPLQSAAVLAYGGALFRFGGMRAENERYDEPLLHSLDEVARYDPTRRAWDELAPMPSPRSSHAACVVESKVVVVGGWNLAGKLGRSSEWCADVLTLDLNDVSAAWSSSPAPFRRRALAAAALEGRVYAIGGMDESGQPSSRVDVLDLASMRWSQAPELPETGFGCAATASDSAVYASARSGRVWRLTPGGERWERHADLAAPRYFHQLVAAAGGQLVAVGGISGARRPRAVEFIALDDAPGPKVETLVVPSPASAKNRQALFVHSGALHFFGGNQRTGQHDFDDAAFVDEGWKFDLATLEWSTLPALPVRRQSLQAVCTGDSALLIGGFARGEGGTRAFGDAFVFDPRAESWRTLPECVKPGRTQFALLEHDRALWLFGGLDYVQGRDGGSDFNHPVEVLRRAFDAPDDAPFERTELELPRPRRAFGHATLDGKLYLVGGLADGFASVPECDVFDFATQSWSRIPSPAVERISPELVALDGALYLAAGSARAGADAPPGPALSIERFDPARGVWETFLERLPFDPTHVRMFAHRGRLLVVSTHDTQSRTLRVAWITP